LQGIEIETRVHLLVETGAVITQVSQ
jgi:hypothetical protein